ncbi:MAG: hypothetical protein ACYTEZ_10855 [Planctomycetota bacterium]
MTARPRFRARDLVVSAAVLAAALPATAAPKKKRAAPFLRGICYTSHVAAARPQKQEVAWLRQNGINLVAIDFFGIAHNYARTDFATIARLVKRLKREGVTVLADYRPSTTPPGKAHPGQGPDLCLSRAEVRQNITGWGIHLLDRCPGIDILTIYNPLPRFERNRDCRACRKKGERALLQQFFAEWSAAIRKRHPKVKLGAVFPAGEAFYRDISKYLDVFSPFCSVIAPAGKESCGPGVMKEVAGQMRALQKRGPVIPLVKLYWREATRNTTADILHAMAEAQEERLDGFYLWYYSLLTGDLDRATSFKLPEYDLEKICERFRELAGKEKKKKKRKQR